MLFSSISFLYYFLPITIMLYFISSKKHKNTILLVASLIFYFTGEPSYTLLMLSLALSGYIHGLLIDKYRTSKYKILILTSSLVVSLGSLTLFKYGNFIITNINNIFSLNIRLLELVLPLGISFYTFQIVSYVVDVYKGEVSVCKSFSRFLTYVCLFPQLIAGPIVRYTVVYKELIHREHSFEKFASGVNRFIIGLGKKVILANNLGLLIDILSKSNSESLVYYWVIAIVFSLQIYYDFSGYSDMAIGLGSIFGFNFPENFNYPYIATSITEFWRRWHISLSSFFRDYVYIPMGGNRVSVLRWIVNIFVVWVLTGLWHGASWNFVLWGLYFALVLIIEKIFLKKLLNKLPKIIQHIYSKLLIIISFVIFSNESLERVYTSLFNMFNINQPYICDEVTLYYLKSYSLFLLVAIIGVTPLLKKLIEKLSEKTIYKNVIDILGIGFNVVVLIVATSYLIDGSFNPFLYFRF